MDEEQVKKPRKQDKRSQERGVFSGFRKPDKAYFSLPNEWTDITADIQSLAELKIIEYVIRHTWGFNEFGGAKHITLDEFMYGREKSDGSRMDKGTQLSDRGVKDGIELAVKHGYVIVEIDSSDLARVKKRYGLKMLEVNSDGKKLPTTSPSVDRKFLPPDRSKLPTRQEDSSQRSRIPTGEIDSKKDTSYAPTINQLKSKGIPKDVEQMIKTICNKYDKANGRTNMGRLLDIYQESNIEDPAQFKQLMQDVRTNSATIEQFFEVLTSRLHEVV